jgi:TRAP-type C4-dicarboxylate transport system substrate-binding protein
VIRTTFLALALLMTSAAWAKLPAPAPEAVAKAAEAKQKADEAAKKDAALLAKSQDKTVANYRKNKGAGAHKTSNK